MSITLLVVSLVAGLLLIISLLGIWMISQLRQDIRIGEREHLQNLIKLQQAMDKQMALNMQQQQKSAHSLQQQLLVRFARMYQAVERRFGEMQNNLTLDAGNLRVDLLSRFDALERTVAEHLAEGTLGQQKTLAQFKESLVDSFNRYRESFDKHQQKALESQQTVMNSGMAEVRRQVTEALSQHTDELGKRVDGLTRTTEQQLKAINAQVEKRLAEGFEKTTQTFTQVLNHLTRIDEAQKKITELSNNVVSLQEVLSDKRSRGAFGEVQLNALVRNLMPENSFSLQHSLSNGMRVDCMLFLPEPTGHLAVDAKFPLESYKRMTDLDAPDVDRKKAATVFRQDIKRHINDIADKYILPEETADGAMMFIPAEAVFAEIHGHFPDLVEMAYRRRVWMVSPTTMMAILTTARAVLKDAATREQVDVIQLHLHELSKDFGRFQSRMDKLAQHIQQAHKDVDEVAVSARRISGRFEKIERVELESPKKEPLPIFKGTDKLPS